MEIEEFSNTTSNGETLPMILCCLCSAKIQSNPANMCINCLKSQVDITEGISKQVTIFWCKNCGRYQRPPWVQVELESREMLALCLKKIKGLNKDVKLVDASFVWTEPHSKRIKIKLTIQKEVFNHAILQQKFVVEFVVQNQQCTDCQKSFTEHTWTAVVQVRQKGVSHKKTFFHLEQLLLKHNVCDKALSIKEQPDGLDFYWSSRSGALHMLDFLKSVVPIKSVASKRLISSDLNSNVHNFKYTLTADIAPICKDDIVLLPPKLIAALGGVSPLMLVLRVTSTITLLDPLTLKVCEISSGTYFSFPFRAVASAKQMQQFDVLDVEKLEQEGRELSSVSNSKDMRAFNKQSLAYNNKLAQANVTVARSSDFGKNDTMFETTSHLGNVLKAGDLALGYDLSNNNLLVDVDEKSLKSLKGRELPQIWLVRKTYPDTKTRVRKRNWQLRHLNKEAMDKQMKKGEMKAMEDDQEEYMREIEETPELRKDIMLFKKQGAAQAMTAEDEVLVSMDELLDDMGKVNLNQNNDNDLEDEDIADEEFLARVEGKSNSNNNNSLSSSSSSRR